MWPATQNSCPKSPITNHRISTQVITKARPTSSTMAIFST